MPPSRPEQVLKSEFAGDPDMAELIVAFLDELPGRIDAIRAAEQSGRLDALTTVAHQLKGSAAGYGYGPIGVAAARVEQRLRQAGADDASALAGARRDLAELVELCRSALRGR